VGGATLAAEKVLAALAPAFVLDSHSFDVGASIGIALCPEHGEDAETLLRRADVAMYVAKRAGSGYSIYEPELDQHSRTRLSLIGELRNAIDNGDLVLYFQPKAYVATACVDHLEALVRWRHPDRGLIPPDDFVPLAEQTGLIKPLTMWVLEAAFHQCREWHSAGRDFSVAVNLSMRNLLDPHLADYISGLIQRFEVPAQALELELTESIVMADPERTLGILQRLHDMGIRLTIDDFGTGYSSLAYLKRLPVDEIKIDRSFVTEMASDDNDAAIVRSIINLAHDLGLEVTGEGVEDSTTWKLLVALGCDAIQGAYLGLAMPAEDVEGWIRRAPHQFGLGAASSFP
jgi:EAL domain-containing protein (putative c-di-GMP-specific phosphodiesterase class I)